MKNRRNRKLVKEYKGWLNALNYSLSKQNDYTVMVTKMFTYMEQKAITRLDSITKNDLTQYKEHLQQTKSSYTGNPYSQKYINTHLGAIRNFVNFLKQQHPNKSIPVEHLKNERLERKEKEILSRKEIEHLFELTKGKNKYLLRDRAMLSVFYGLGLRRSEGTQLYVKDIDFVRNYVHVRHGKGNKERIVPMSNGVQSHLKEYLKEARPMFTRGGYVRSFFVSNNGTALDGQVLHANLKSLIKRSTLQNLKEKYKAIGLHSLRHSIATHLMDNGMDFENISLFLGHSSSDSTQIYTHLKEVKQGESTSEIE